MKRSLFLLFFAGCASGSSSPASGTGNAGTDGSPPLIVIDPDAGSYACPDAGEAAAPSVELEAGDPLCRDAAPVSFGRDVLPLVACTGEVCHVSWQYKTLVGAPSKLCCDRRQLVEPGAPSRSHLVQALRGEGACVAKMPPGGSLSDAEIAKIVAWICQGAPDD